MILFLSAVVVTGALKFNVFYFCDIVRGPIHNCHIENEFVVLSV